MYYFNKMSKEEPPKPSSMHMAHSSNLKDPYGLRLDLSTPLISKAMYNLGYKEGDAYSV